MATTLPPDCQFNKSMDCDLMNLKTCQVIELLPETNTTHTHMIVDSDGCLSNMDTLGDTVEYFQYRQFSLFMGVLTILIGALGLLGNMISIAVFLTRELRNCFHLLMVALNITDSFHIIFAILDVLKIDFPDLYNSVAPPDFYPLLHYPLYRISMCSSIYIMMAVGVERYLAVCRPHHYREVQNRSIRVLSYILPAILAAVLVNITKFLEVKTVIVCYDYSKCGCQSVRSPVHTLSKLRLNKNYIIYYHLWTWIIITGIFPFSVLVYLNWKIYFSIKRLKASLRSTTPRRSETEVGRNGKVEVERLESRRSRRQTENCQECSLATVLLTTVITFLLLHLPRIMTSVYEAVTFSKQERCEEKEMNYQQIWFNYCVILMNTFLVVNASSNFFIYILAGPHFKKSFTKFFIGDSRPSSSKQVYLRSMELLI